MPELSAPIDGGVGRDESDGDTVALGDGDAMLGDGNAVAVVDGVADGDGGATTT